MSTTTKSNSLRANTLSQGLPVAAGYVLNVATTPVVVHRLGLEAFGTWAITVAVAQYGAVFDFGVSRSVTRFVAFYHAKGELRREREVLSIALAALAALGACLLLLAVPAGYMLDVLGVPAAGASLAILASCAVVVLVCGLLGRAFASFAFGRGRMVALNCALAASNSLMALSGVVVLLLSPSLNSFALGTAGGAVFGLICVVATVMISEKEFSIVRPRRSMLREILGFGLRGQTVLIADLIVFQSSKLIIGAFLGASAAGVYELGSRLALGGRTFGSLPSTALTPVLTAIYSKGGVGAVAEEYENYARRTVVWGVIWPLLVAGAGPSLILFWLGYTPKDSVFVVIALSLGFAINVATGTATVAALSAGRADVVAKSALATIVMFVLPVFPMTLVFGVRGAVGSVVVATVLGAAYGVRLSCLAIKAKSIGYYRAIGAVTVAGVLSAAVAASVDAAYFTSSRTLAVAGIMVAAAIVACGFLGTAWVRVRWGQPQARVEA